MDVKGMRRDLEEALSAIRELNEREAVLLHKLGAVRSERKPLDAAVLVVARSAEQAQLRPSEYRVLFGDLEAEIAAATTRAALNRGTI